MGCRNVLPVLENPPNSIDLMYTHQWFLEVSVDGVRAVSGWLLGVVPPTNKPF